MIVSLLTEAMADWLEPPPSEGSCWVPRGHLYLFHEINFNFMFLYIYIYAQLL